MDPQTIGSPSQETAELMQKKKKKKVQKLAKPNVPVKLTATAVSDRGGSDTMVFALDAARTSRL